MGRVLIQKGGWTWRYKNKFCESQKKRSLECYYHPLTHCTLQDAAYAAYKNNTFTLTAPANDVWGPADDKKLTQLLIKYGNKGYWDEIAKAFGDKTPAQCGRRWKALRETLKPKAHTDAILRHAIHHDERTIADYEELEWSSPFHRVLDADFVDGHPVYKFPNDRYPRDVIAIGQELILMDKCRVFVPKQFVHMLNCYGMKPEFHFLWWRAIAISYFIRPNHATLELLKTHQDEYVKNLNGQCISTYVRHGDKGIEMQLVPTQNYINAAEQVWKRANIPGMYPDRPKVFYIASDDFEAMERVKQWGRNNRITIRYSNLSQTILSDRVKVLKQHDMERGFRKHREMEYFSYILHIADSIMCEVFICTWPSNYCRIIDELRTTIGGKANRLSVDLSVETCTKLPCIRNHGLGNFKGDVHDPKIRLWR